MGRQRMKQYTLIYDEQEEWTVQHKILPAFAGIEVSLVPFRQYDPACYSVVPEHNVITYVGDEALAALVSGNGHQHWTLGILPHPNAKEVRQGFGLSGILTEAIEDIKNAPRRIKADLLLCNGAPVFNKVVIGNSLSLMSGSVSRNRFVSAWEKLLNLFRQSKALIPRAFTITAENKPPLKTAAIGIIAVLHGKSTLFSRKLLPDSSLSDGRMHSLILAPRSLMQLLRFSLSSLLKKRNKLPPFVGHIKSRAITISSPDPVDFSLDNALMSAKEIELRVSEAKLFLFPGRYLQAATEAREPSDQYRVSRLPKGETYLQEIVGKPLSLLYHASTDEFKGLFQVLRENAQVNTPFLTLMVLSTLLATFGLFSNSSPVIIGAMILAPLMAPIISLSMGVLRQEKNLMFTSIKTIGLGLLLSYLAAILLTLLTPLQIINSEIGGRIRPNLLDLGVAIVSGVAGAYAHARREVAKTLAGVAIAVALVPPLAVSGIGLGWGEWGVFTGALLLFLTNLAGIVLAGSVTFMLLGFSPFHLAKKGLLLALLVVGLVSLPLGFGFMQMVRENQIIRSLNNQSVGHIKITRVDVLQARDPMLLRVQLLSDTPIRVEDLDRVKKAIATKVGQEVALEATVSIRR